MRWKDDKQIKKIQIFSFKIFPNIYFFSFHLFVCPHEPHAPACLPCRARARLASAPRPRSCPRTPAHAAWTLPCEHSFYIPKRNFCFFTMTSISFWIPCIVSSFSIIPYASFFYFKSNFFQNWVFLIYESDSLYRRLPFL